MAKLGQKRLITVRITDWRGGDVELYADGLDPVASDIDFVLPGLTEQFRGHIRSVFRDLRPSAPKARTR